MVIYDMSISRRRYDGKHAVWALIPDPTMSAHERATIKVSSFPKAPKNMTPPLRWVITGVFDSEDEALASANSKMKPTRH